jgi:hypothetical protein
MVSSSRMSLACAAGSTVSTADSTTSDSGTGQELTRNWPVMLILWPSRARVSGQAS